MARARLVLLLALAGALSAAAGCGGGGGDRPARTFTRDYVATQKRYESVGLDIVSTLKNAPNNSDRDLATLFKGQAAQIDDLRAKLDGLDPPERARQAYQAYLDALRTSSADLRRLSVAAGVSDAGSATDLAEKLVDDLGRGRDARLALERAAGVTDPGASPTAPASS